MNVFNRVTLQSLKKNKTRTIVTIIGIILSASMICASTTFTSSMINYAREVISYSDGNWHGSEMNCTYETYEKIQDSEEVSQAIFTQQLGYALAEGCTNEYKPYIYLLGASEGLQDLWPIHITTGHYPETSSEILLPEHLYTNGGVKYEVGDTITLDLGQRVWDGYTLNQTNPIYVNEEGNQIEYSESLEISETRTYTVSGFYERLNSNLESYDAPGYTAITIADSDVSNYPCDVYFAMNNPKDTIEFMESNGFTGDTNNDLLMSYGASGYSNITDVLYNLAAIVIVLIMFGSVSLIYNAFSISVSERTRQFGLLSSIGATKKQLKHTVLFEAMAVSVIGIPIGIIVGIGGIGVTLMLIGDKFRSMGYPIDMTLSVSPLSIVIAVVISLVTVLISAWIPSRRATKVSAVEAIRQNVDVNTKGRDVKTSGLTYKLFGISGMLASKYYKRSRKKYRATILSLFMSIVLFVSAFSFTDYLMESVTGGFSQENYDISFSYNNNNMEDSVDPDSLLSDVKGASSVTDAAYVKTQYTTAKIKTDDLSDTIADSMLAWAVSVDEEDPSLANISVYITFVDDGTYRQFLKDNGLSEQEYMNPASPKAIAIDHIVSYNGISGRYETINFLKSEGIDISCNIPKDVDGYIFDIETVDDEGNPVLQYISTNDENDEVLYLTPEEGYVNTQCTIGKIIEDWPFFASITYNGIKLLYPMSLKDSIVPTFSRSYDYYSFYLTSSNHSETYTAVEGILTDRDISSASIQNLAQNEEAQRNLIIIIRVFAYGFIVLISLIAAANVFNTISTNINLRRREFAMLKSVGMTRKGFNKMMNYECLLYGTKALLYGLPVACLVTFLIWKSVSGGFMTSFHLPWMAIGISVFSVFAVVFATMMYAMGKIKKDNVIDALKNENL